VAGAAVPAIAVVVPFQDRLPLLNEALASLQSQTLTHWEALLVNDRSHSATLAGLGALVAGESRFRLLANSQARSAGACGARNTGLCAARAPLVVFLDSDDLLQPGALAGRVAGMAASPDLDYLVHDGEVFDNEPGDVGVSWNTLDAGDPLDRFLAADTPWQTSGPTWRAAALARLGPWPERAASWQDWEYHIRALCSGLRYGLVAEQDYSHRRGHAQAMRLRHNDLPVLVSRADTFARVAAALKAGGYATHARQQLLAGLCLRFALKCGRLHGDLPAALRILAPVSAAALADAAWLATAREAVVDAAAGRNAGELDASVTGAFPVLQGLCNSPGRERARNAPHLSTQTGTGGLAVISGKQLAFKDVEGV